MIRTFGVLENTWFKSTMRFPLKIGKKYVIHKLYEGEEWFKEPLKEWERNLNNSVGRYPYVIKVKNQRQIVDRSIYSGSLKNLATIIRFSSYNRTNLAHSIDFNNRRIQGWVSYTDSSLPSYFRSGPEDLNRIEVQRIIKNIKRVRFILRNRRNVRLWRSIYFWDRSSCSDNFERNALELFIALESLFTTDRNEISYQLANRMSWLIENKSYRKRRELFDKIRAGYSIRSQVVHGKNFVESTSLPLLRELHAYTRLVLLKILENNDLMKVFVSNDDRLFNTFFYDLVAGRQN